jgi:hypothetical protein
MRLTKVLLGGGSVLQNFNDTGLELLDGGNVLGEDTHITRGGSQVDLLNLDVLVDGLAILNEN